MALFLFLLVEGFYLVNWSHDMLCWLMLMSATRPQWWVLPFSQQTFGCHWALWFHKQSSMMRPWWLPDIQLMTCNGIVLVIHYGGILFQWIELETCCVNWWWWLAILASHDATCNGWTYQAMLCIVEWVAGPSQLQSVCQCMACLSFGSEDCGMMSASHWSDKSLQHALLQLMLVDTICTASCTYVTPWKCGPRDSTRGGYKWTFWCIHPRHIGING
jgi:hypothetical protein